MDLEARLKALEKSPKFQHRIRAAQLEAIKNNKTFGHFVASGTSGVSGSGKKNKDQTNQLIVAILNRIAIDINRTLPNLPLDPRRLFDIVVEAIQGTGQYRYSLTFKPEVVRRRSLYPEGYPEGLQNIVAFHSHGGGPSKNAVWNRVDQATGNYWEGEHIFIRAGTVYPSRPFLRNSISEINRIYGNLGVKVVLNEKYYS